MAYTDDQMVKTAKALSDENRLRILAMLKREKNAPVFSLTR